MPIVSKSQRDEFLLHHFPVLHKLCVADKVPPILEFRLNTTLPFCYGHGDGSSTIPAPWDTRDVDVFPLWEDGSGLIAIRKYAETEEFIQIYYENPSDVEVIAKSQDGLFVYVFYFLMESAGGGESEEYRSIEELATYLDFDKLPLVAECLPKYSTMPSYDSFWDFTRSI